MSFNTLPTQGCTGKHCAMYQYWPNTGCWISKFLGAKLACSVHRVSSNLITVEHNMAKIQGKIFKWFNAFLPSHDFSNIQFCTYNGCCLPGILSLRYFRSMNFTVNIFCVLYNFTVRVLKFLSFSCSRSWSGCWNEGGWNDKVICDVNFKRRTCRHYPAVYSLLYGTDWSTRVNRQMKLN